MVLSYLLHIAFICIAFQSWTCHSQCTEMNDRSDTISDRYTTSGYQSYRKCWKIKVPTNHYIKMTAVMMDWYDWPTSILCDYARVDVHVNGKEVLKICSFYDKPKPVTLSQRNPITADVEFFVDTQKYMAGLSFSFRLNYNIFPSHTECTELNDMSDYISDSYTTHGDQPYRKCWKIIVHSNHNIKLSAKILEWYDYPSPEKCNWARVKIERNGEEISELCSLNSKLNPVTITKDHPVIYDVEFFVDSVKYSSGRPFSFELSYDIWDFYSDCTEMKDLRDSISDKYTTSGKQPYYKCWKIRVPPNTHIDINIKVLEWYDWPSSVKCDFGRVAITMNGEEMAKLCGRYDKPQSITLKPDRAVPIDVEFYVNTEKYMGGLVFSFELNYKVYY